MGQPLAIAFLHGVGRTHPGYSAPLVRAVTQRFARKVGSQAEDPAAELIFEEVNWSCALQPAENRLWRRLKRAPAPLRYQRLRHFMLDFAADAIAYQPTHSDRSAYDAIHAEVAAGLTRLAARAGDRALLCIVAHSLGTVIASNYLYDLMKNGRSFMGPEVLARVGPTPLERGETFAFFATMGSPLALWSLRFPDFGVPICVPPPALRRRHPGVQGRWVNFYDPDDVLGYPLRPLSRLYAASVTEDRPVNVGSWLTRWNPLAHSGYWNDGAVADQIAENLADIWRHSSAIGLVPDHRAKPPQRRRAAGRATGTR
jgi:hypothetical protein